MDEYHLQVFIQRKSEKTTWLLNTEPSPHDRASGRDPEEHPIYDDPRLDEPDQVDWSRMEPNEFYPSHVRVGDKIAGLTVVSVMREHIDHKSYTLEFEGELILEGSLQRAGWNL